MNQSSRVREMMKHEHEKQGAKVWSTRFNLSFDRIKRVINITFNTIGLFVLVSTEQKTLGDKYNI